MEIHPHQNALLQIQTFVDSIRVKADKVIETSKTRSWRSAHNTSEQTILQSPMPPSFTNMSNTYGEYTGYGYGGYGCGYGGYGYGTMTISEREKALEREKKEWHVYWTKKEEQCQMEQKEFKERGWKRTGELWQHVVRLNVREEEIVKREEDLAKREKELVKHETSLEEEKAKVMEQYKRVKKLERQGKRREERIQRAKERLQQQANEHFSIVYQTLQLGIKSLHHQTSSISVVAPASVPTPEPHPSTRQPVSPVELLSTPPVPFRTAIRSNINCSSSLFEFGKVKVPRSFNSPAPAIPILSKRHSPRACTPTDKDEFDKKATSVTVEAVNLVSTEPDPCHTATSVIDSDASLINVSGKKINGKHYDRRRRHSNVRLDLYGSSVPSGSSIHPSVRQTQSSCRLGTSVLNSVSISRS